MNETWGVIIGVLLGIAWAIPTALVIAALWERGRPCPVEEGTDDLNR